MKKIGLYQVLAGLLGIIIAFSASAQNDWKNWDATQLDLAFTKKLDLRLSHLRSYNISNSFSNDFNQSSVHLDYDFTKKFSLSAGATFSGSQTAVDGKNRVSLRATYKTKIADALSWSNSIQGELFSANETRYSERIILITRVGTKKRLDFLRLSPSVSYSLFYNLGGSPIQYFDPETGENLTKNTADGFHRGRLTINLNSKITNNFSISVYYMMQNEFNLLTDDVHKINVINPNTGKVTRQFDKYKVLGLTLAWDFKLYKKNKN